MSSSTSSTSESSASSSSRSSSSSSSSSSDSDRPVTKTHGKRKRESEPESKPAQAEGEDEDGGDESESDVPVLSHAEKRRQKRKQKLGLDESHSPTKDKETQKSKRKSKAEDTEEKSTPLPKRQNSIWVGNLSYRTTPVTLRTFFDGVGEITRVHMPMKASQGPNGGKENRGFAYVDFGTPDAKVVAITMSETFFEGRKLLIKDGDDFTGRPDKPAEPGASPNAESTNSNTKFAQKILAVQKQPAGPTLFLGNLSFETTEGSIRQLFDAHRPKMAERVEEGGAEAKDKWIRRVRLGTFEDSGLCKGWAFVDFHTTDAATAALTHPRNHHLDGRKLVVEYASPEAVRRGGGGPPKEKEGRPPTHKRPKPFQTASSKRAAQKKVQAEEGPSEESPAKRRRVDTKEGARDSKGKHEGRGRRQKPGAALAQAPRASAMIVPSQGKKITFS